MIGLKWGPFGSYWDCVLNCTPTLIYDLFGWQPENPDHPNDTCNMPTEPESSGWNIVGVPITCAIGCLFVD
jgi:hypothetical protein